MSVWSVRGDEVWYSGWRAENYLSCITALVGPQDLEVKRLFNVQFFSRWSIDSCWSWRPPPLSVFHILTRSAFCFHIGAPAAVDLDDSGLFPNQGSLQLSRALASTPPHPPPLSPPPRSPFTSCSTPTCLLTPSLLLLAPAWVINYLMESIWC